MSSKKEILFLFTGKRKPAPHHRGQADTHDKILYALLFRATAPD